MSDLITEESTAGGNSALKDRETYQATLAKVPSIKNGSELYPEPRLEVEWLPEGFTKEDTVIDWISFTLRQTPAGDVSKLRQLLNALAGKPEATKIAWFNKVTLEWSYDGLTAHSQLAEGLPVAFRGKHKPKKADPAVLRYRIDEYSPASGMAPAVAPPLAGGEEYQYSPDGKLRWKPGMPDWEPVPATAAAPTPSAVPAAGPPPLPATPAGDDDPDRIPF